MRGGHEVLLQDGFTARESTQFRAAIGPCGSGGVAGFRMAAAASLLPARQYLPPADGKKSLVHIHSVTGSEVRFEINQTEDGETELLLTDVSGNMLTRKTIPVSRKGRWEHTISTAGVPPGFYYLHVVLNKRVEHRQELIIR
jgi:hypothetical protein